MKTTSPALAAHHRLVSLYASLGRITTHHRRPAHRMTPPPVDMGVVRRRRERIAELRRKGLSQLAIAAKLKVSVQTVKNHCRALKETETA